MASDNSELYQRIEALVEDYMGRSYPSVLGSDTLGGDCSRPEYEVVDGRVHRRCCPPVDLKIVSVASCLPDEWLAVGDSAKIATMAFDAIRHYAAIAEVEMLFFQPYFARVSGKVEVVRGVPPEEACRVYAGVENLLLEIYEGLPRSGVITDDLVVEEVREHVNSIKQEIRRGLTEVKQRTASLEPYFTRVCGKVEVLRGISPGESCRVYAGVENLLPEIYQELTEGGTNTDLPVKQSAERLIKWAKQD